MARLKVLAAVATVALVAVPVALAASSLVDGGFERPIVHSLTVFTLNQSLRTCTPGTARGCWLERGGELDLVPSSVWLPASGSQSVELNGGSRAATITQSFSASAGSTYRISFYLAGNPAYQGGTPMTVQVAWEDIGSSGNTLSITTKNFTFDTTGKTPTSMGWTKHSFKVTSVPGTIEGRLFFTSLTDVGNSDFGPAIDKTAVVPVL